MRHAGCRQQEYAPMKTIAFAVLISLMAGCSNFVSTDDVAATVKNQMQQDFASNQAYEAYDFNVIDLTLKKEETDYFKGLSTLKYQGKSYPVEVEVFRLEDGSYLWQVEPEQFAFVDDVELERYKKGLDREFNDLVNAIEFENLDDPHLKQANQM